MFTGKLHSRWSALYLRDRVMLPWAGRATFYGVHGSELVAEAEALLRAKGAPSS